MGGRSAAHVLHGHFLHVRLDARGKRVASDEDDGVLVFFDPGAHRHHRFHVQPAAVPVQLNVHLLGKRLHIHHHARMSAGNVQHHLERAAAPPSVSIQHFPVLAGVERRRRFFLVDVVSSLRLDIVGRPGLLPFVCVDDHEVNGALHGHFVFQSLPAGDERPGRDPHHPGYVGQGRRQLQRRLGHRLLGRRPDRTAPCAPPAAAA